MDISCSVDRGYGGKQQVIDTLNLTLDIKDRSSTEIQYRDPPGLRHRLQENSPL